MAWAATGSRRLLIGLASAGAYIVLQFKRSDLIHIGERILGFNPDPIPRYRLLRDVLGSRGDEHELHAAKSGIEIRVSNRQGIVFIGLDPVDSTVESEIMLSIVAPKSIPTRRFDLSQCSRTP